ncbi:MAG: hypothetical protein J6S85_10595 [Methanobrevibacter sp.]|nr:hypothetical protein [Methanobrevibacter sp.]
MVQITKEEAEYLRQNGVSEGITRTLKQRSKRKNFYLCEDKYLMDLLANYRKSQKITLTYGVVD